METAREYSGYSVLIRLLGAVEGEDCFGIELDSGTERLAVATIAIAVRLISASLEASMTDRARPEITPKTPLRLPDAVTMAFPMGGMTVAGLRREHDRNVASAIPSSIDWFAPCPPSIGCTASPRSANRPSVQIASASRS
jgi:hypothetical protein